jgi:hypothetical protein
MKRIPLLALMGLLSGTAEAEPALLDDLVGVWAERDCSSPWNIVLILAHDGEGRLVDCTIRRPEGTCAPGIPPHRATVVERRGDRWHIEWEGGTVQDFRRNPDGTLSTLRVEMNGRISILDGYVVLGNRLTPTEPLVRCT